MTHLNRSIFRCTLIALAVSAVLPLQGCSMVGLGDDGRGKTLADLPAAKLPDDDKDSANNNLMMTRTVLIIT